MCEHTLHCPKEGAIIPWVDLGGGLGWKAPPESLGLVRQLPYMLLLAGLFGFFCM